MKRIVTESYEESSRILADLFGDVIRSTPHPLLGCATGSSPIGLYRFLTEDYRAGKLASDILWIAICFQRSI